METQFGKQLWRFGEQYFDKASNIAAIEQIPVLSDGRADPSRKRCFMCSVPVSYNGHPGPPMTFEIEASTIGEVVELLPLRAQAEAEGLQRKLNQPRIAVPTNGPPNGHGRIIAPG